ncbi:MAG: hypothetical protein KatS3mg025_0900 [Bacteroidia bacterium]|nr:MAG: hypothetical protein KatS3mg025_0900 [Bacteroidia bacterium]
MRIGIFFGGASREREVSYAGGRTVYDLLDRRYFQPIPLFLDAFHRVVRLEPRFLYYGMITDFFPPPDQVPPQVRFPIYAEQLWYPERSAYLRALTQLGPVLSWESLAKEIDVAFLVLHGLGGEDGSIQGLLEQLGIPYTGAGIAASAWGMDKLAQRAWLKAHGFPVPSYVAIPRARLWESPHTLAEEVADTVGFPCVVKHPLQGSTIGVGLCPSPEELLSVLQRCAFTWPVQALKEVSLAELLDLSQGLGLPMLYRDKEGVPRQLITEWAELEYFLAHLPQRGWVEAWDAPDSILVEAFIPGEEFSVIVIELPSGERVSLPPTHIRKAQALYDYRAKYLSGVSSKKTPSESLPNEAIQIEAERLAALAGVGVYARLDGIVGPDGAVYFNDPNTTSGMLPASLLFHQAAEVGFAPHDFLTFLIERSLRQARGGPVSGFVRRHKLILQSAKGETPKERKRIAVVFGGSSTERHISLESGRNVVQKLSSKYRFFPLFLEAAGEELRLWELPPRLLFKDNADDVRAALYQEAVPEVSVRARERLASIQAPYHLREAYGAIPWQWEELPQRVDFVFLALHGRPGEDGTVQARLEALGLPYNGSGPAACALAMDKAATHAYLRERSFRVPAHYRATRSAWQQAPEKLIADIEAALGSYPYIGKPVDEGCSSGVLVLADRRALEGYLQAIFREEEALPEVLRERLGVSAEAFFPPKAEALFEQYLHGPEWIEVTVGVITHTTAEGVRYEAFLPSETVKAQDILRLEEKFLAGAGQNITPARLYPADPQANAAALAAVQRTVEALAKAVGLHGYARIDGFVRLLGGGAVEFWPLEINALPGLTPATVFFHQASLAGYTPLGILEHIIAEGERRRQASTCVA